MRRLASIIVIVVILLAGLFAYGLVTTYTQEVVTGGDPIVRLFKNMTAPATPVILPDPVTIVREVNQLARLETASVELEKVITAENNSDAWLGLFEPPLPTGERSAFLERNPPPVNTALLST